MDLGPSTHAETRPSGAPQSEEEFRRFVAARMDMLRGLAYLTCGDWQAAEDAVARCLAKLYTRWGKVGAPERYAARMVVRADGAWGVIEGQASDAKHVLTAAAELVLAGALRTGEPVPARLPFQAGYLPAGWQLASVSGQSFAAEDTGMVTAEYAKPATRGALQISIGQQDTPPPDAPKKKPRCNAAEHWCTWAIPGTRYYLFLSDGSKTLSTEDLTRIGQALVFDTFDRPATWHPVRVSSAASPR